MRTLSVVEARSQLRVLGHHHTVLWVLRVHDHARTVGSPARSVHGMLRDLHEIVVHVMMLTGPLGLFTTPRFLGEAPLLLPFFKVLVAVEGIAGTFVMSTAIMPLGR